MGQKKTFGAEKSSGEKFHLGEMGGAGAARGIKEFAPPIGLELLFFFFINTREFYISPFF